MKSIKFYTVTIIILYHISYISFASLGWISIADQVNDAELIFKGVLVDKYSKIETIYDKPKTYTTFIFEVKDVLKGRHNNKLIEVKMYEGPNSYNYELDDQVVMFLKINRNNYYLSSYSYGSAFTIQGKVEVLTTENTITYVYDKEREKDGDLIIKYALTLKSLEKIIAKDKVCGQKYISCDES